MNRVQLRPFYVYVIFHPKTGQPCYVGKGKGHRWVRHQKWATNKRLKEMFTEYGDAPVIRIHSKLTNKKAIEIEKAFIVALGLIGEGGILFNRTYGGERGNVSSLETKKRQRELRLGKKFSPETCGKISKALKGRVFTPEWKEKLSKSAKKRGHNGKRGEYPNEHKKAIARGVAAYWQKRREQGLELTHRSASGNKKHSEAMTAHYAKIRENDT